MLNEELLYTQILEVNLVAFAYRLFHEDFSPIHDLVDCEVNLSVFIYRDCVIRISSPSYSTYCVTAIDNR